MWRSKPAVVEHVYSGFMGDCSPEQTAMMETVRAWAAEQQFDPVGWLDDYDMLRFCRARKFVLEDIQTMMTNYFEWRKNEGVDTIIDDFEFPELDKV